MAEKHPTAGGPVVFESLGDQLGKGKFGLESLKKASPRIKTGFRSLDAILGGGIAPGLLILGGIPSLGKSTLALNIAKNVSAGGTPVLFYSYEMPEDRIMAKLVTCQNCQMQSGELFTAEDQFNAEVLEGWSEQRKGAFRRACDSLEAPLRNLFIIDCNTAETRYHAGKIKEQVDQFVSQRKKKPLVIIDYLQVLPPVDEKLIGNSRLIVEDNITRMVGLARSQEYGGLPVLLISSLSRGNYREEMQIDSFKETGSIEYSADVLLGIQFTAVHGQSHQEPGKGRKQAFDLNVEKEKEPREVEVAVLKQRYGRTGTVPFLYRAKYDFFYEAPEAAVGQNENGSPADEPLTQASFSDEEAESQTEAPRPPRKSKRSASVRTADSGAAPAEGSPMAEDLEAPEELEPQSDEDDADKPPHVKLEKYCINNTMIARDLRSGNVVAGEIEHKCLVIPTKNIYTTYQISEELSSFDCDVADALYSIFLSEKYFSKENTFSLRRILTVLTGDSRQTLTGQKRAALLDSIAKLKRTEIRIQCREELDVRNRGRKYRKNRLEAPHCLLSLEESGGRYYFPSAELGKTMPLYAYADMTMQIVSFPSPLLDVRTEDGRKALNNTAEVIAIKHFLLYRLEVIRNKNSVASKGGGMRRISFNMGTELMNILGVNRDGRTDAEWKRQCKKVQENVETVLEYYKRIHYISGYALTSANGSNCIDILGDVRDPWKLPYETF